IDVQSLQVNQITGAITGDGPGRIDSVHLSRGAEELIKTPGAATMISTTTRPGADDAPALRHLGVQFSRNIEGNIHNASVNLYGDVKTVYGPAKDWGDRLTMDPGGRPGPHTLWITCDQLGVTRSPLAAVALPAGPNGAKKPLGQVELLARTNVVIEGEDPQRGAFTMRGNQATYDQSKTMFVLQGD